jgi:hypothetical protein
MGGNVIEVLMGHIRKPAPDAREKEPRTPDHLAELCLHMMQKDPAARPADAKSVARALESS